MRATLYDRIMVEYGAYDLEKILDLTHMQVLLLIDRICERYRRQNPEESKSKFESTKGMPTVAVAAKLGLALPPPPGSRPKNAR